jgi:hypothetical protein
MHCQKGPAQRSDQRRRLVPGGGSRGTHSEWLKHYLIDSVRCYDAFFIALFDDASGRLRKNVVEIDYPVVKYYVIKNLDLVEHENGAATRKRLMFICLYRGPCHWLKMSLSSQRRGISSFCVSQKFNPPFRYMLSP